MMEKKLRPNDSIKMRPWKCSLANAPGLSFEGHYQLDDVYFFYRDQKSNTYAVIIPAGCAYRVVEESDIHHIIMKMPDSKQNRALRAYRVSNSDFVKELLTKGVNYLNIPTSKRDSYLILTEDFCVEFFGAAPIVKVFKKKSPKEIFTKMIEKSMSVFW
jgi:hypothetical protein